MPEEIEIRVALLEARQQEIQKDLDELFQMIREHMETEAGRWENLENTISRWRGFTGGIIFVVSALWAAITTAISYFK